MYLNYYKYIHYNIYYTYIIIHILFLMTIGDTFFLWFIFNFDSTAELHVTT